MEIATGMEYLATNKVVHGDLAAKNIFLTSNKTTKIGGLGHLDKAQYHLEAPNWRWMAPESISQMEFTEKTDVWAFGITLWEIYSVGQIPYAGWSWTPDFPSLLEFGHVELGRPAVYCAQMHSVMKRCSNMDASGRPTFAELKEDIICIN